MPQASLPLLISTSSRVKQVQRILVNALPLVHHTHSVGPALKELTIFRVGQVPVSSQNVLVVCRVMGLGMRFCQDGLSCGQNPTMKS